MASSGCCTGSEIDLKSLKTPGQNQMGEILGPLILQGMQKGATPFTGQLSAGPDQAQMAAMQAMMGIGGQGPYQQQSYPTMGAPGQGGFDVPPWNPDYVTPGGGGGGGGGTITKPQLKDPGQRNQFTPEQWQQIRMGIRNGETGRNVIPYDPYASTP